MPDVEEPMDPIDPPPHEPSSSRKRPSWLRGLLDDVEGHAAPRGTFHESKKPNRVSATRRSINVLIELHSRHMLCSQNMVEPHHIHWIGAKNLLRYLRGTITYGLRYIAEDVRLLGYTDVDWAGNVEEHKSTSECCFSLGSTSISWMSRKQKSMALSTTEEKYIAASMASCEAVSLQKLFNELFGFTLDTTVILFDNQSGIRLSENPVFHDRSKHIDIKYHYIQDMVQQGAIRLQHIGTDEQVADILTKPLGKVKFLTF
eukprot:PITA_03412